MIEVCAAVVVRGMTILVARRARPVELVGKWEFPGGKLEVGESPQECLVRELREELAYDVSVSERLGASERIPSEGGNADLRLTAYAARPIEDGDEPTPIDGTHDRVRWVTADELSALDLAPLDVPLVVGAIRLLQGPNAHLR